MIKIIYIFLIVTVLSFQQCINCPVDKVQIIDNLKNNKKVVSYISCCGATVTNSLNVSFYDSTKSIGISNGKIFYVANGWFLHLEKISIDTIKVYYTGVDIRRQKNKVDGIVFIYELVRPSRNK